MPQRVACYGCGQHFMAADEILGTVVPCPNCGSNLPIPAPQPLAAQPLSQARALPPASFHPSADSNSQWTTIIFVVVGLLGLLWLVLVLPNVLFWAIGRPAASLEKVVAGAAIFWIGVLVACGGIFEWSLFKYSRDMRVTRQWFGENGAKWFYGGLGSVAALTGLGVTLSATAYSLFSATVNTSERPDFAAQQTLPQPLDAPQVTSPPPASVSPPASAAARPDAVAANSAAASPPDAPQATVEKVAAEKTAASVQPTTRREFSELPGQWRYLEGGYCIKIPESIVIDRDSKSQHEGAIQHNFGGCTAIGKPEGVNFAVHVQNQPRNHAMDSKSLFDFKRRQPPPNELSQELLVVNGLEVVKTPTRQTQASQFRNRPAYTLNGMTYHFADKKCMITLSVYSQLPLDHADQQAIQRYLDTFQRMPQQPAPALAADGTAAAEDWQLLEGGLRIRMAPSLEVRLNNIHRGGANRDETTHNLHGQTADGVEFKVDVIRVPMWNKPNEARRNAAARSERPRPDYEHVAVDVNGMVMERITHLPHNRGPGMTRVEYRHQEGQHQIIMFASSKLPLDHPSFQTVLRVFESIERTPE
jgi:hypothetical protein